MNNVTDLQVLLCIVNLKPATGGFNTEYHQHPFYELGFVLEGACHWGLRGRRGLDLAAGQVVLLPPACAHRERSTGPVRLGWLGFASPASIEPELLGRAISLSEDFAGAQELLRRIGEEQTTGRTHASELIRLAMRSLLLMVQRAAEGETQSEPEPTINPYQKRIVTSVAAYLERNVTQPLTLVEVARYHHLSAPHLSVIFRRYYGMTPTAYRLRHRIERAKTLLQERPELGLKRIAAACGFTDATHFGKEFRRWTGRTPRQAD